MKHVVRKAFFDFEKEEKFINEMSAKGLALTGYSWCKYVFEDAPKGEYIYRIELLENPVKHQESQEYIRFMEETGTELVASYYRWVFFRRKAADGDFTIYSDIDSRLHHYKRIRMLFVLVMVLNFIAGFFNLLTNQFTGSGINFYMGILSSIIFILLLLFLVLPLNKKIVSLEKEKSIRE